MIARSQAHFGKIRVSPSCPNASASIFLLLLVIFAATGIYSAQGAGPVPRVLILYPYDERIPATNIVGEAARTRLVEATSGKVEVFSEFLDLSNFARIARYLAEKYSDGRPDLVIALGEESTRFIVANRNAIAPNAKIVLGGFGSATAEELRLPNDVVGALTEFEIRKTVEMAIGLQPDARQVVVIAGSAEFDKAWVAAAQEDLIGLPSDIETTYLTGLSIEEFVERVAALPPDTIVIVLTVLSDRTGWNFVPRNSLEKIAKAAISPVYGPYSTYLDHGVVGGNAATFKSTGAVVAGREGWFLRVQVRS
ncbi:hypothetical protein [Sinorhizobium meliloti]|uniref:hypothetical protein n=1 Tax=Rhizobium meliloti TaxID=382 RepID=UPI00238051BA|nr:hypothetical protein [Sinorhizobium meliloti]